MLVVGVENPKKSTKMLVYPGRQIEKKFLKRNLPAVKEYCFDAYVVKEAKSDTMHCEHLCLAGAVAPSFTCWLTLIVGLFSRRDPRNSSWTICILPLSSNLRKLEKNLENFIHTGSEIFILGPNLFVAIDCPKDLFVPGLVCSYPILFYSYRIWNIHTGFKFICYH